MIKLFRKLRWSSLSRKRFPKYLVYAAGEIVLVVIGILIALQINTWNEEKKVKQEEEVLIKGLILNIEKDIKNLNYLVKADSIFMDANKILLSAFKNDSIRNNKRLLTTSIINSVYASSFSPTQIIFNQMQYSGKLNYILNDSIKNNIQSYYDYVAIVMDVQESNLNLIYDFTASSGAFLDANSALQPILPEFAQEELDEFDNSFFFEPLQSDNVKEFADNLTGKQILMFPVLNSHKSLLIAGMQLRQDLTAYLDVKN